MNKKALLHSLFHAESVAVVGASENPQKTGHKVLKNLIDGGYEGKIFAVNPRSESILGIPCSKSLSEIGEDVDLVVVIVPAKAVPGVMREAAAVHAKGAVIITGGFREIGNTALEQKVMDIAGENGIAVIGPNCQGINYTPNKLCASWPLITGRGSMAILAQSGSVGAAMSEWAAEEHVGFTAMVAMGNKSQTDELDLLEYFSEDPETRVVALNIEGVRDGPAYIRLVKKTVERKAMVVLKPGRTDRGSEAAQSHTRSVAGSDKVFQAVCRKLGVARAMGFEDFYDAAKILSMLEKPAGRRLMILTSSGGSGIIAVDTAVELQIETLQPGDSAVERLRACLPNQCVLRNPLDLTGDTTADRYVTAVEALTDTDFADSILLIFADPIEGAAAAAQKIRHMTGKPVLAVFVGAGEVGKTETLLMHERGIPVFPTPERAVRALGALLESGIPAQSREDRS